MTVAELQPANVASMAACPESRAARIHLADELFKRYGTRGGTWKHSFHYQRKKWLWHICISGSKLLKRFTDVVVALSMILVLSPLFLVVAACIKLTDRGPVLFWQKRVGKWGQEFPFPKFRSMLLNAEQLKDTLIDQNDHGQATVTFKMKNDPRVTWIGKIIRKLSIDELPQLWCVLKGEMSLVGPRPPVPREVELYTLADRRRLDAVPGLTCIWQVSGRGDIAFNQQVELDVDYIECQSFWGDIKLLLKTVPAVLLGKGAY